MNKGLKINPKEHLFLREEIMLRTEWHIGYTKSAITTSTLLWTGTFVLINYFPDKDFLHITPFIFLFPILIMYPLSFKIYENYVNFCNITPYLKKFHEKPINENDGTYFSWETAHGDLLKHFSVKNPQIIKAMNWSNNELAFLSAISLFLFLLFSVIIWLINNTLDIYVAVSSVVAMIIGILFTVRIYNKSSYKCLEKLSKTAHEFWESYPKEEK